MHGERWLHLRHHPRLAGEGAPVFASPTPCVWRRGTGMMCVSSPPPSQSNGVPDPNCPHTGTFLCVLVCVPLAPSLCCVCVTASFLWVGENACLCVGAVYNAWDGGMKYVDVYLFPCYSCGNPAGQGTSPAHLSFTSLPLCRSAPCVRCKLLLSY